MSILLLRAGLAGSRAGGAAATYLLDDHPGAAVAVSTRKLDATAIANAIRVFEDGGSTEDDIGYDNGNLDETDLTNLVGANSGFAATLYDASGNAINGSQATALDQPRIVNAGTIDTLNGHPSLLYDGSADWMDFGNTAALDLQDFTIYVVVRRGATGAFHGIWGLQSDTGGAGCALRFTSGNVLQFFAFTGAGLEASSGGTYTSTSDVNVFVVRKSGTSVEVWDNTTSIITDTLSDGTVDYSDAGRRSTLGAMWLDGADLQNLPGDLPEWIVYGSAHSVATREAITADLVAYWVP